jgi:hypothetical protein
MGPLPAAGQWVRLEIPASVVALEGSSVTGMAFTLYDGAAIWDLTGKASSVPTTTQSGTQTVTVVATDPNAVIGSVDDTALVTFTRAGSTTADLTVNYTLGGTATKWTDYRRDLGDMPVAITIPAGAASATMKILAISSALNGSTAIFTLSADAAYTIGTPSSATLTFTTSATTTSSTPTTTTPTSTSTTTDTSTATTTSPTSTTTTISPTSTTTTTSAITDSSTPTMTVVATDAIAMIGNTADTALLTFSRTGSTASDAVVNYTLSGTATKWNDYRRDVGDMPVSITIPAGASSATMTIVASSTAIDGSTAVFNLTSDGSYAVGSPSSATITLSTAGGSTSTPTTTSTTTTTTPPTTTVTTPTTTTTATTPITTSTTPTTVTSTVTSDSVWFDDQLPAGASVTTRGGDSWNWVASNPAPFSGTVAHQSASKNNLHEHTFSGTSDLMKVGAGDKLFVYVYLDPSSKPSEVMVSWYAGNWEHRAYWGANSINYGTDGTASRFNMGAIPATGQWVRLEIPANVVGLENSVVTGMGFHLQGGRATWDKTGKSVTTTTTTTTDTTTTTTTPTTTTTDSTTTTGTSVTVAATDAIATVGSSTDTALVTFTRTGSTSSSLLVNYGLGGTAEKWTDYRRIPEGDMPTSVTIPAGASSATMTIGAYGVKSGATYGTAIFTLSSDPAYTIATSNTATLTIATSSWDGTTTTPTTTTTTTTPSTTTTDPTVTTPTTPITPTAATAENAAIRIPQVGDAQLRILTPTVLELQRITSGATDWNFVDASGLFNAPAAAEFAVTASGQTINVSSVGFRRRVAYGTLLVRDLRVDNSLYLTLASPIAEGETVEVKNASGTLWPSTIVFKSTADAGRYNPAIHVNQEGYVPSFPKKAMIGYYLGNKGEMDVDTSGGFRLVEATTGTTVFTGTLTARKDIGYSTSPLPYQKVLQADFTSFRTPGEYQLLVPGLGASLPFVIDDGVAMAFERTYALGLYHQRCGCDNALPYSRFTHGACHILAAEVPSGAGYDFTWGVIASETANAKNNPRHTAPAIVSEDTMLYPFVNKGKIDVSGGHHDAGDYSKYTINVANLVHQLMFNVDSIAGADALDNLGVPGSGDGISDIMQKAKHEADFLAKMQDADGGFYFLVYPKDRRYEADSLPDNGIQQVVWPKTTSVSAASVAALAQMASSPKFKAVYPAEAAAYLQKAKLGWQFLINAIAKFGKDGAYQKITHYGDEFMHDDELAWAACELFLATGDAQYQQKLLEWFPNPADPNTMRWTWVRLFESYGNTIRSYAFAARSGRLPASALNSTYLAACENQIKLSGDDMLRWSTESAYGTAFPDNTKRIVNAGWYFSLDQASDMAVAYQLNPKPEYIEAIVSNMNYEAGSNPVNVSFLAGVGLKRQREMVNQYALNDRRLLPPIGLPAGNIAGGYSWLGTYGSELGNLSFPADGSSGSSYVLQDRWADIWNVTAELVTVQQARAQVATSFLAAQTASKSTAWKPGATATIVASASTVPVGQPVTLSIDSSGLDLAGARITWEARDQQPDFGSTYTIAPKTTGAQWVEVEITWADGRRMFGTAAYTAL